MWVLDVLALKCLLDIYVRQALGQMNLNLGVLFLFFWVFFLFLFRVTPLAYGNFQVRGLTRAIAAGLCHSHNNAAFSNYTTTHGNAGSLTH